MRFTLTQWSCDKVRREREGERERGREGERERGREIVNIAILSYYTHE